MMSISSSKGAGTTAGAGGCMPGRHRPEAQVERSAAWRGQRSAAHASSPAGSQPSSRMPPKLPPSSTKTSNAKPQSMPSRRSARSAPA